MQTIDKFVDDLAEGDILCRIKDNCLYKLNNISWGDAKSEDAYMFFGFSVLSRKNLKKHFKNEYNKFIVYKGEVNADF